MSARVFDIWEKSDADGWTVGIGAYPLYGGKGSLDEHDGRAEWRGMCNRRANMVLEAPDDARPIRVTWRDGDEPVEVSVAEFKAELLRHELVG